MKVAAAIAEILKLEGIDTICGYPVNGVLEAGAAAGIRPVIVRQERTGLHMADAMSRQSSGEKVGIFCMQYGPGTENAFGGVAQAYSEAVPTGSHPRRVSARTGQCAPQLQRRAEFPARDQVGRDAHQHGAARSDDAASVHSGQERPTRDHHGRDPAGHVDRRRAGAAQLHPHAEDPHRARS